MGLINGPAISHTMLVSSLPLTLLHCRHWKRKMKRTFYMLNIFSPHKPMFFLADPFEFFLPFLPHLYKDLPRLYYSWQDSQISQVEYKLDQVTLGPFLKFLLTNQRQPYWHTHEHNTHPKRPSSWPSCL